MATTLKIKTWLPVFPGFYGTIFEADEETVIESPYTFDDYEFYYEDYFNDASKQCVYAIEDKLKELGLNCKIVFEQLRSPREYNFSNDAIDVTFKVSTTFINKLRKYCTDNSADFDVYLERYKDSSGFISYYSSNLEDWLTYINETDLLETPHLLGALLNFVLENEDYTHESLYYAISDKCWLFGSVLESSKPTDFELNGLTFCGNIDDVTLMWEYNPDSDISFFDWCLNNLKQLIFADPNQLSLAL